MTKTLEKTRFHWLLSGEPNLTSNLWDQELLGSRSFAVVPSLGSLVPGWLLIVPRRQMISLRDLREDEIKELERLLEDVASSLTVFHGKPFAFEHGSARKGSAMGCGVDQAHLHVVPLTFDLVDWAISQPGETLLWRPHSEILLTALPSAGEYISVWELGSRRGALATVRKPASQWMRRAIAKKLGIESDWDYRTSPQEENIRLTVEKIRRRMSLMT